MQKVGGEGGGGVFSGTYGIELYQISDDSHLLGFEDELCGVSWPENFPILNRPLMYISLLLSRKPACSFWWGCVWMWHKEWNTWALRNLCTEISLLGIACEGVLFPACEGVLMFPELIGQLTILTGFLMVCYTPLSHTRAVPLIPMPFTITFLPILF